MERKSDKRMTPVEATHKGVNELTAWEKIGAGQKVLRIGNKLLGTGVDGEHLKGRPIPKYRVDDDESTSEPSHAIFILK